MVEAASTDATGAVDNCLNMVEAASTDATDAVDNCFLQYAALIIYIFIGILRI